MRKSPQLLLCVALAASYLAAVRVSSFGTVGHQVRPDRSRLTFGHDARGRDAYRRSEWRIASGADVGLIISAAVCDDRAFLLDRPLGIVHRVDLIAGSIVGHLGGDSEVDRLVLPTGLAADCDGHEVYVVDSSGVVVFDADWGMVRRRFSKPPTFVNDAGPATLDLDARKLYVPGLWTPVYNDWLIKPVDRMFEGDRVGYELNLDTGATSPLVPAVERGCWSLGPNCLYAMLDRVRNVSSATWIAAPRVGTAVGVFDAALRRVATIDVRSPLFLEDGQQNGSTSLEDMVAWNERNSVIRGCFSFGETVATVHTFNRTKRWKPGDHTDFDVFMNLHSLTGEGLMSDIRLPDLPVGRDAASLYVVEYGSGGRHASGHDRLTLVRIPIVP